MTLEDRIEPEPNTGCWLWTGALSNGYGQARVEGKVINVHRYLWIRTNGPVPQGMELDHICRVRCCVNPLHLRAVSHRDNCLESRVVSPFASNAAKTHCQRGHPFDDANTYRYRDGRRDCRACIRLRAGRRNQHSYNQSLAGITRYRLFHFRHKEARNAYSREYMRKRREAR